MKAIDFVVSNPADHKLLDMQDNSVSLVSVFLKDDDAVRHDLASYDLVFCPGNSFGHMTGGFDQGVVDVFGTVVEIAVRNMIAAKYFGMMPVGSAEVVVVDGRGFVYTPTMFVPTQFTDAVLPYMAMYSSLVAVARYEQEHGVEFKKALCPLYCAGTGGSTQGMSAYQQQKAYSEFKLALGGVSNGCANLFKDGMRRFMDLVRSR